MTEQDNTITPQHTTRQDNQNTPQDKTNTSQDNQNTQDNNTTDQTTTHNNAPHYITKSPQHNTKILPLQVLGGGTSGDDASFGDDFDAMMEALKWTWVSTDSGEKAPAAVEVVPVMSFDLEMEESLTDEQYVKLVVNLNPITVEQADSLQEWWKDEKGEI